MIPALGKQLAVDGGTLTRTTAFPSWPYFAEDEIAAVVQVMGSGRVNYWTGDEGRAFEREFADSSGCKHAVAVSSGTVALELALRSLGVVGGDDIITSCRTFIASASSIVMCGARPIFADVDRNSQNISADTIQAVLTPRTRAILVVHLAGWPCDMDPILELGRERGLFIIEDCAQAQGAMYKGRQVGSFGHAATFSFCQDKIMTTLGEGGVLTTSDSEVWRRAKAFRDHGRNPNMDSANSALDAAFSGFRWVHESVGTNWRLTEVQSAVGRRQLRKAPGWIDKRRSHAQAMFESLSGMPALRIPMPCASQVQHSYYRFYAFVRPEELETGWHRDRILAAINSEGIPCFAGSCGEVYLEKALAAFGPAQRLPIARELAETSMAFLVHPTLTETDIGHVCDAVRKVMSVATRRNRVETLCTSVK
jgi:dTDP-4-amino-4,6-dideoxygalactose transaminase